MPSAITPRVDIMLPVLNGAETLPGTLESLRSQSFQDFRVVAQDGGSTDGTLDLLREAASDLRISLVSEPDRNLVDAWSRCVRRLTAPIVGITAADERLEPRALELAVACLDGNRNAVACIGNPGFIEVDDSGAEQLVDGYSPGPFGLKEHLACEMVPPMEATFLHRGRIGEALAIDPGAEWLADYALLAELGWRFGDDAFVRVDEPFTRAFRSNASMSFRPEFIPRFAAEKHRLLGAFIARHGDLGDPGLPARAAAGISMWAAEQLWALDAPSPDVLAFCRDAVDAAGPTSRLLDFLHITRIARVSDGSNELIPGPSRHPPADARVIGPPPVVRTQGHWHDARVEGGPPWEVTTSAEAWGYSAEIVWMPTALVPRSAWLQIDIECIDGAIGAGAWMRGELVGEVVVRADTGRQHVSIPLENASGCVGLLRSAGRAASRGLIYSMEVRAV